VATGACQQPVKASAAVAARGLIEINMSQPSPHSTRLTMGQKTTGPVRVLDFVPMAPRAVPNQPQRLERHVADWPGG